MYSLVYRKTFKKDLKKLDISTRKNILFKINQLIKTPRPVGAIKLQGVKNLYRIRHGDYRVIYEIHDGELVIVAVAVGHRKEIYRDF